MAPRGTAMKTPRAVLLALAGPALALLLWAAPAEAQALLAGGNGPEAADRAATRRCAMR